MMRSLKLTIPIVFPLLVFTALVQQVLPVTLKQQIGGNGDESRTRTDPRPEVGRGSICNSVKITISHVETNSSSIQIRVASSVPISDEFFGTLTIQPLSSAMPPPTQIVRGDILLPRTSGVLNIPIPDELLGQQYNWTFNVNCPSTYRQGAIAIEVSRLC